MTYLETGCRAALAFVFLVASTSKIHNAGSYREFHESLSDLGLPSAVLVRALSAGIPVAEAVTVVLLAVNHTSQWGLFTAVVLVGSFTAGIAVARAQGKTVRCRCFGESGAPSQAAHVVRNVVLLGGAAAGALASLAPAGRPETAMVVFAAGLGIIAAALFLRWDELSFLLQPATRTGAGG
jgi:Methylamine utilisation protein MauE